MLCIQGNLLGKGLLGFLPKFTNVIFTIEESLVVLINTRGQSGTQITWYGLHCDTTGHSCCDSPTIYRRY